MGSWVLGEKAPFFQADRLRGPVVDSKGSGVQIPLRRPLFAPCGPASAVLGERRQRDAPGLGLIPVISPSWVMTKAAGSPRSVARCLAREGKTLGPKTPSFFPASVLAKPWCFLGSHYLDPGLLAWIPLITKSETPVHNSDGWLCVFNSQPDPGMCYVCKASGFCGSE